MRLNSLNPNRIRFTFVIAALHLSAFIIHAQTPIETQKLTLNQPLTRQIKGGETQEFQFKLKKGDFARAEVEPSTMVNVIVSLLAPDGKLIVEMDGDSNFLWRESVSTIAETSGIFRLQIKGKSKNAGDYTVKIVELRKSVVLDRKRIEAEQTLIQAIKLSQENKSKEAATAFEKAANLWKEISDKYWEAVTAWNLAWAYIFLNRNDEALKLHNQALLMFQELKYRIGEAGALGGIGNLYLKSNNLKQAEEYLEKSLAIRKELKRLRSENNILSLLGSVYNSSNQTEKLIGSLERKLVISKELKDRELERDALNLLGLYYSKELDFAKAQPYLEQALEIDRELKDNAGESERLLFLATVYGRQRQYEKAQKNIEKALEIAINTKDRNSESKVLSELGSYNNLTLGNFDKGREFLLKALTIKRELNDDKQGEISILSSLALASQALGDYPKQIEYSNKGLELSKEINDESYQIDFLQSLAIGYQNTGQIEKALELYEQSLTITRNEKLKSKEVIGLLQLAGFYGSSAQQYEKERELEEQALIVAKDLGNKSLINIVLSPLGSTYSNLRQYDKAREFYEQAIDIAKELNDKGRQSSNIQSLGLLFAKQRQFDKAQDYFEQALKIAYDQDLTNQQIYILSSLGSLSADQSKFEQSINYFEQAFNLAVETKNISWQISLNASLGNTYLKLNQYEKAQSYFEKSLAISKESKSIVYEAIAYISLGDMYFRLNQYEKSRDHFEQVIKISQRTNNKWLLGFAASGIGSVYTDLSNNEKAQSNIEQSLSLMRDVSDRSNEGSVLNSLGRIYLNLKNYDKAQKYFEDSLAIAREIKNKQGEVYPLINLGEVFKNKNQLEKAKSFYEQGLSLAREVKDRSNEGYVLNGYGEVYFKNKKYKEAEDFYRQSLAIAKEVQSKKLEGSVLQNLMDLFNELKKTQIAIIYGKQAVNVFQQIRGNIKSFEKESQQSYLKDKETAYRTLADLLVAQERFPEAQAVLNLLKDEEFSQLASRDDKSEVVPYSDIEARLLESSEKLSDSQAKYDELLKIENPTDEQKRQTEELRIQLNTANAAFDAALKDLEKAEKSVVEPVDSFLKNKNIQGALSDLREMSESGVVALYTLLGREETVENKDARNEKTKFGWVIMVTQKGAQAYPIDVTNFNETVFQLKDALSTDRYDPRPVAQKLYNAIFRQKSLKRKRTLEQDLQEYLAPYQNKTVMWSLDGVLRYVPMAALHDGKNYLVEKYLNTVFTEKSIISLVKENRRNWKILGLGVSEARENFAALPGVKIELETIVREENSPTGILNGAIKMNGNFTRDAFFRTLNKGDFPVVHIASHYSFNPAAQAESFLLMGDGHLAFSELKDGNNLFGAVDLLTLSACETGTTGNGKEAEGFPIKAQELGAKAVLASLWKVSDAGTPELMIRFYKLRSENPQMSKGEAFRQAQLSLLGAEDKSIDKSSTANRSEIVYLSGKKIELPLFEKDEKKPFAHPHYWSSFVLIGNWR